MAHVTLDDLPPPVSGSLSQIQQLIAAAGTKLVVLDDDPTGTQTVHGVPVLTEWSVASLETALQEPGPCFYILTNSRARALAEAMALNREIAQNLRTASARTGRSFKIVSRSDSTLRGHFPGEVDALVDALGRPVDGVLIIPAFFEGGRTTVHNIHYVADGNRLVPAGETEFARDTTFGYRSSNLALWVEEKTHGRVRAENVAHIDIALLRGPGGAAAVRERLVALPRGAIVTVDAADYADVEVFVLGLLEAEAAGRFFVARTAASFVRVYAGVAPRSLVSAAEIAAPGSHGGLTIVGSYVAKTTGQLENALMLPNVTGVEVRVDHLADPEERAGEIARCTRAAEDNMRAGRDAILYTSRKLVSSAGRAGDLDAARVVSTTLVAIVCGLRAQPRFFIAKGGITSSDLATEGLGVRKALVLGQAAAGIPVWRLGAESRFPGMSYVVFPGNVGGPGTLRCLIEKLGASGTFEHR